MTQSEQGQETSLSSKTASDLRPIAAKRHWWQRPSFWLLVGLAAFIVWFIPPVWQLKTGPIEVIRYERVKGKTQAKVGPDEKNWTPIRKISRHALNAIIASEDGKFYQHHGIDWDATWKSFQINLKRKRYVRGGSTISQQVVKMAFLEREKTLVRKTREAIGTLLMELVLPKEKILEWYINLAEFGDGVYSVAAASRHYFNTKPELLTIEQGVHLALVLPSPNRWSKGLRNKALTPFGHRRFAAILNNMRMSGSITKGQWSIAVKRGDFGRPLAGYQHLLSVADKSKPTCVGATACNKDVASEAKEPQLQGSALEGYDDDNYDDEDVDDAYNEDAPEWMFPRPTPSQSSQPDPNTLVSEPQSPHSEIKHSSTASDSRTQVTQTVDDRQSRIEGEAVSGKPRNTEGEAASGEARNTEGGAVSGEPRNTEGEAKTSNSDVEKQEADAELPATGDTTLKPKLGSDRQPEMLE